MRIAAIADLHGHLPPIPPCDLLILAGDICPDAAERRFAFEAPGAQLRWFDSTVRPWVAASPAARAVATWGNHDYCGELPRPPRDRPDAEADRLQVLVDERAAVAAGGRSLAIWATPWSNLYGHWAFMKEPRDLAPIYARIPEGIDILVSHQPPFGYGDLTTVRAGSRELLAAIDRVRPRAVICGHIHEGHGRYDHNGIPIYNVAQMNEFYEPTHAPTLIEL